MRNPLGDEKTAQAERILIIDPFSGASGDMLLGSLLDAGLELDRLVEGLNAVDPLRECEVKAERVRGRAISATRLRSVVDPGQEHRSLSAIVRMIEGSSLPRETKAASVSTFELLARAEAAVHGCDIEQVHFHEVGALDAILDVVGFHLAVGIMGLGECYYTKLRLGSGEVESSHGMLPVPAPATLELLKGRGVEFTGKPGEMITPTAAAIIASCFRPLPPDLTVIPEAIGYGAGARESAQGVPNVLRAVIGRSRVQPGDVCLIRCTIDDMNPELYGFVMEKLFELGALEVYYDGVMMKKNRPGLEVNVLCEEEASERLARFLLSETTTLGVRISRERRMELVRYQDEVETPFGVVKVKVAELPGGTRKAAPEFESCREAARRSGARLLDVFESARAAWMRKEGNG